MTLNNYVGLRGRESLVANLTCSNCGVWSYVLVHHDFSLTWKCETHFSHIGSTKYRKIKETDELNCCQVFDGSIVRTSVLILKKGVYTIDGGDLLKRLMLFSLVFTSKDWNQYILFPISCKATITKQAGQFEHNTALVLQISLRFANKKSTILLSIQKRKSSINSNHEYLLSWRGRVTKPFEKI